jgi:prepilin-type N-terminal cleavage/methylation domain-containing protein
MGMRVNKKGFTLVEISIVMAIAALILTGILVYVGVAERNSRNARSKDNLSKVQVALEQWASTHSGTYLSGANVVSISTLYSQSFLGGDVKDVTGGSSYSDNGDGTVSSGEMVIRDRTGGTSGSGYCVRVLLSPSSVYGATDTNKAGRLNPC